MLTLKLLVVLRHGVELGDHGFELTVEYFHALHLLLLFKLEMEHLLLDLLKDACLACNLAVKVVAHRNTVAGCWILVRSTLIVCFHLVFHWHVLAAIGIRLNTQIVSEDIGATLAWQRSGRHVA